MKIKFFTVNLFFLLNYSILSQKISINLSFNNTSTSKKTNISLKKYKIILSSDQRFMSKYECKMKLKLTKLVL